MKQKHLQSGLTLIEIVVVVSIIAVLVAFLSYSFFSFREAQALQNTTNGIVSMLSDARAKTLASYNNSAYGIRFEEEQAIMFIDSYTAGADTNEVYTYESPVVLSATDLNDGGSQILFDRLKGTTDDYGTITLSLSPKTRTITVHQTGAITRN